VSSTDQPKTDPEIASYAQILRSSSIIGGASVVNILVGLLRTKVAAVLLGPAGVGLIGLLQSLMATAATVSALGFGNVGTRQIAEANATNDAQAVATVRRALFWGTLGLAVFGASVFWLLRDTIATTVLGDSNSSETVAWLAVGVALTVAAGSQGALLNGLRRIGDIARISILSALLSTLLGVSALWLLGEKGVLIFVLSAPLSSFLLGHWFVSRLPRLQGSQTQLRELQEQWKTLARLGAAFMVAGLAVTVGQLVVRTMVQRELGAEALGHFQAAWMISMTYVGFVLGAMGTDYYPRLTATIRDHAATNQLVNEQTEVALLLAGPVLVAMLGLAPWVIELLYSREFAEAADVLRWQVLGDILKVASWPMGFIILAAGDGRVFMLKESAVIVIFVGLVWVGLPYLGIQATGTAFLGMYLFNIPVLYWLARRRTGFAWHRRVYMQLTGLLAVAGVVFIAGAWSKWLGAGLGSAAAAALFLFGLARIGHMTNIGGSAGRMAARTRELMVKTGVWRD
jgi:PST family polysaccharide transporter